MVLIIVPHDVEHLSSGKLHGDENINNVILILKIIKIVSIYWVYTLSGSAICINSNNPQNSLRVDITIIPQLGHVQILTARIQANLGRHAVESTLLTTNCFLNSKIVNILL